MPDAAPPLPDLPPYHLGINGQIKGPFNVEEILDMMDAGEIDDKTLGWTAGMADWTAIGELDDFEPIFANMPPPMPGRV